MNSRRHFLHQAGVLATFVSACPLAACSPKVSGMTEQEAHYIDHLMERSQTRCVGRYLVDLPDVFVANTQAQAVIDHVDVQIRYMDRLSFDNAVQRREVELRKKHMDGEPENPFLKRIEALPDADTGLRVFNRAEDSGSADFARTLELWAWKDGYLIRLSVKANESEGTAYATKPWIKDFPTDTPQKLAHLLRVFSRIRGRKDNEVPSEQGDCIANGFVAGPSSDQQAVNVPYHLQGSPDLFFDFNHRTTVRERDTMLERTAKVEKEMQGSGTQTIRKGKRDIGGMPFEEWLMRGPTPDRVPGTMFMLHGNETASDPATPFVDLRLFNGFRIPAPERTLEEKAQLKDLEKAFLTEAQALALWDKVTATLRVRPGAL
jgi:Tle cognate immunity protein 4 C-terminal domain/Tle cognate immunity protein 4 N-terminal domain